MRFCLIPGAGAGGCFGLSAASDYDLSCALVEAWFCQLQMFSEIM